MQISTALADQLSLFSNDHRLPDSLHPGRYAEIFIIFVRLSACRAVRSRQIHLEHNGNMDWIYLPKCQIPVDGTCSRAREAADAVLG